MAPGGHPLFLSFVVVAALVAHGRQPCVRRGIRLRDPGTPGAEGVLGGMLSGGRGPLVVVGVCFVLLAVLTRRPRLALIVAATLIAASLLTDIIKDLVARPRPPGAALVTSRPQLPVGPCPDQHRDLRPPRCGRLAEQLPRWLRLIVAVPSA